jgi:hypothetical protein
VGRGTGGGGGGGGCRRMKGGGWVCVEGGRGGRDYWVCLGKGV